MATIHSTAVVDTKAIIADDVVIGPFCVVGGAVSLGPGTRLESHVVVDGDTTIGVGCHIFPFASIGLRPQDLKYAGEASRLIICAGNTIREGKAHVQPPSACGTCGSRSHSNMPPHGTTLTGTAARH